MRGLPRRACGGAWRAQALTLVAALLTAGAARVPAAAPSASAAEVRALEQRWLDNLSDAAVVGSILADDFVHVLPGGFINKAQHLDYLRSHPDAFRGTRRFSELTVRIYGHTALATGIVTTDRGDGSPPRNSAFTDVFVLRGGRWQAVNAQELTLAPSSKAE